jgi:hypothetical protein
MPRMASTSWPMIRGARGAKFRQFGGGHRQRSATERLRQHSARPTWRPHGATGWRKRPLPSSAMAYGVPVSLMRTTARRPGARRRVGADPVIVLLVNPALGADVTACDQLEQIVAEAGALGTRALPSAPRGGALCTDDHRSGSSSARSRLGNLGHHFAVMAHAQDAVVG